VSNDVHASASDTWQPLSTADIFTNVYHSHLPSSIKRQVYSGIRRVIALLNLNEARPVSLATAMSGSDLAVHLYDTLLKFWREKCGFPNKPLRHILSVEKVCLQTVR